MSNSLSMPDDNLTEMDELPQVSSPTLRRRPRALPTQLSQQVRAKRRRYTQAGLAILPPAAVDLQALARIDLPAVAEELLVHRNLIQAMAEEMVRARGAQETSQQLMEESRALVETMRQKIASMEVQRANQAAQAKAGELEALRATQARQAAQLAHLKQELAAPKPARPWWRQLLRRP